MEKVSTAAIKREAAEYGSRLKAGTTTISRFTHTPIRLMPLILPTA
jgi:hypothetical protein